MIPSPELAERFRRSFEEVTSIGRDDSTGGCTRWAWTPEDRAARGWFEAQATSMGLDVEVDRNGNQWAWWGRGPDAVATGSHLDTVGSGGAFDGALGIVSSLVAVEELQRRGVQPRRPVVVVNFWEEEGARFGIPTAGSGLLVGHVDPTRALRRGAPDGTVLEDALESFGVDPSRIGADPERAAGIACYVEVHIEQGRSLVHEGVALGIGTGIWGHGRWKLDARGEANHAGTTRMGDRRDPALILAAAIDGARREAIAAGGVATIGRVELDPNVTNAVPGHARAWLDARASDDEAIDSIVEGWREAIGAAAAEHGVEVSVTPESRSRGVSFDEDLRKRIEAVLEAQGKRHFELPSPAGHDAGEMSAVAPAAMLFVRNPTGVSHNPAEHAGMDDCVAGVAALCDVLEDLAGARPDHRARS